MKKAFMVITFGVILFVAPTFINTWENYKKETVNDYTYNDYEAIGGEYIDNVHEGVDTISWVSDLGNVVIKLSSGVEAIKDTAANIWGKITDTISSWFEGGWFS